MTPAELFGEIADRITLVCKQPYRSEPVTQEEWSLIRDAIITLEVVKESYEHQNEYRDRTV